MTGDTPPSEGSDPPSDGPDRDVDAVGGDGDGGNPPAPPEGNDRAVGNAGGPGAPPGNKRAGDHFLYTEDPAGVLEHLREEEPAGYEWVMSKYSGYLERAPFSGEDPRADLLLRSSVQEYSSWKATGVQVVDGLTKRTHIKSSDGELVPVEDEQPVNLPANRLEKTVIRRLKELDVLGDDSSSQGDMESEAYRIVDVSEDVDDSDDEDTTHD